MALSKKQAAEISQHINSLECYAVMTRQRLFEKDYAKATDAMCWHDEAADKLITMGIAVIKYKQ